MIKNLYHFFSRQVVINKQHTRPPVIRAIFALLPYNKVPHGSRTETKGSTSLEPDNNVIRRRYPKTTKCLEMLTEGRKTLTSRNELIALGAGSPSFC